jgi:hypothetical protein
VILSERLRKHAKPTLSCFASAVFSPTHCLSVGQNTTAGAVGGGIAPITADLVMNQLYPGKTVAELNEEQKQTVAALTTLTGTLAGGLTTGNSAGAVTAGQVANNEVLNNYLSPKQIKQKQGELAKASTPDQKKAIDAKYKAIDAQQRNELVAQLMTNELGVMTPVHAEQIKNGLNALLSDPTCTSQCRIDVQTSINELNVQLSNYKNQQSWNTTQQPILDLAEGVLGILGAASPYVVKNLSSSIGLLPGSRLGIEAEARIANQFYRDGGKWVDANGGIIWPKDNGFIGMTQKEILPVGARLDRYGGDSGRFLSPVGTPFEQRAIPNASKNEPYKIYEVLRPFEVKSGKIAPWFDQPGMGVQYFSEKNSVQRLIEQGYIREVKK